jgi:hypothetical protein
LIVLYRRRQFTRRQRKFWKTYDTDTDVTVDSGAVKIVTPLLSVSIVRVVVTDTVGVVAATLTVTVEIPRREEQKASAACSILSASTTRDTSWHAFGSKMIAWAPRRKRATRRL